MITDYYTSTRFRPVRTTARASQTGHATNIIQGLAQGFQSTAAPAILLALGILVANELAGIYGIGVAVMAQLSLTGLIVALDAFGPITDNAGGIAEMADLPEEVRNVTDPLDAVGNTTKAVTKGYAIGSAVLAALVLFAAFIEELREEAASEGTTRHGLRHLAARGADRPADRRHDGLPVRRARDRGRGPRGRRRGRGGAPPVPGEARDHGPHREAGLRARGRHRHGLGAARDDPAGADPDRRPGGGRPALHQALGGLLIGVIVVGFFAAVSMTSGGGAWDNAKKLIEDGEYGGKGSEAHAASVTGDTVGDPYKDTAGPAINPMIKVANIVALLIVPFLV